MKILFFTMTMQKGGAERVISTLCNNWPNEKDKLYIATCLDDESQFCLCKGVLHIKLIERRLYQKKGKIGTLPIVCKRYKKVLDEVIPDVVIGFLPEPCYVASLYKNRTNALIIGSERGNPYFQYKGKFSKLISNCFYGRMDGFVFQTEGAKNFFSKRIRNKSVIIGNPLDDKIFLNKERNPQGNKVVAVGRFTEEKNYSLLIKAFAAVLKVNPCAKLYIYGRINEELQIEELVCCMKIENSVFLMGEVNDIQDKIIDSGVYVMSSRSEGMPNALMEAMALGLPVIATDCPSGGPRQLIKDGYNGLLVKNEDEESLANAIIKLISDRELAEYLGRNAKNTMKDYKVEKICKQWQAYIRDLCEEKKR